ncbi:MAG: insulinase family protein [Fibrobacteres bacterium]|nr:insulinase family protein [Fibrobacterota bacterium]
MKMYLLILLTASALLAASTPYDLKYKTITYNPPSLTAARDTLKNGIIAFIVPDNTIPVFDIKLRIRGGAMAETEEEKGIASAAFALLADGGYSGVSADSLSELMEFHAISLTSGAGTSEAVVTASCISKKADTALSHLYKLILNPSFDEKKLAVIKSNFKDEIASRYDAPKTTLNILQAYALYGRNRHTELMSDKEVDSITQKRIMKFFKRILRPENIIIAVSGRFDRNTMIKRLNETFGSIKKGGSKTEYADLTVKSIPGFLFIDRPSLSQSSVKLALTTVKRPHPDYYRLTLMNWILGGAPFTSRISKKVREEEGLAYSAGSSVSGEYFFPGIFSCYLETKSGSTAYAISLVYQEIDQFLKSGATDEELATAKQSIIDAFPASFKTAAQTASAFSQNQYNGDSDDRYSTFREKINAITKDQILETAKKYLKKDQMTLTVVGNYSECMKGDPSKKAALSDFGTAKMVTEKELTKMLGGGEK